jgi:hypothetical protein
MHIVLTFKGISGLKSEASVACCRLSADEIIPMILIQILREITMAPSLAQLSRLSPKSALTAAATVLVGAGFYVFIIFQRMR